MALRIATLGDNCMDRYLPPVNRLLAGGNAVNVAVQLARLGQDAAYFGAVGADREGLFLRAALAQNGVALAGLLTDAERRTAYTDIETLPGGERRIGTEDFGACAAYRLPAAHLEPLRGFGHVHIGWLNDGGAAKHALRSRGLSVSQDLSVNNRPENLQPEGLSIAFLSADPEEAEARADALLAAGAGLAVVTMGAAGSLATDGRDRARIDALPVVPVDTTGAGDSFIAGFLSAKLGGAGLAAALQAGAAAARATCLHPGGFPQPDIGLDGNTIL